MAENKLNEEDLTPESVNSEGVTDNRSEELNEQKSDEAAGQPQEEHQAAADVDPLEEAKQEIGELKDKYLRLYAEFENFRKRTTRERVELIATANAGLLKSLLPVLDDFERAIASFDSAKTEETEALREGVDLIYTKFLRTLESEGLKAMEAKGEAFDADLHESVAQFPAQSEEQKGKIIEVLEKGYYLNDKVIRYAKVVVGV